MILGCWRCKRPRLGGRRPISMTRRSRQGSHLGHTTVMITIMTRTDRTNTSGYDHAITITISTTITTTTMKALASDPLHPIDTNFAPACRHRCHLLFRSQSSFHVLSLRFFTPASHPRQERSKSRYKQPELAMKPGVKPLPLSLRRGPRSSVAKKDNPVFE